MTLDREPEHQPNFLPNDQKIRLLRERIREMLSASEHLPNKEFDVFISYRQAESRDLAAQIFKALLRTRHPTFGRALSVFWDDVRIKAGQNIHVTVQTAIRSSTTFIILLSPTYNRTEYTTFEHMLIAGEDWGGLQERIIPVLVQDCEIPERLRALKYLDFRSLAPQRSISSIESEVPIIHGTSRPPTKKATQRLPKNLRHRIGDLSLRPEIEHVVKQVLTADNYPTIMMLSRESVVNPIGDSFPLQRAMNSQRCIPPLVICLHESCISTFFSSGQMTR
jgi:TIR domain